MSESPLSQLPEQVEWEQFSPSIYLSEAVSAVLEMFDPHGPKGPVGGSYHRTRWARIAVVFAAFAAEGFINRALMRSLSTRDFDALDRLATVDKYAIGARLAFGKDVFDRGSEPLQTLAELFELRNRMAHPKPRTQKMSRDEMLAGPEADVFTPRDAVRFVTAVAAGAATLGKELSPDVEEMFASLAVGMRSEWLRLAELAESLPRPTLADYEDAYGRMQNPTVNPESEDVGDDLIT